MSKFEPGKLFARFARRPPKKPKVDKRADKLFIKRLENLFAARRFVLSWVLLLLLLIGSVIAQTLALKNTYESPQPVRGGIYSEGILGDFTTADPLFSSSPADSALDSLVFAGLFKYNSQNQLVGNLASSWSADSLGKVYTVKLKPGLTWQDGQPLTAADVVFTYHAIQNPDTGSPLYGSWQDVNVTAINQLSVKFSLSNPLASFPYSLTNAIVPQHILGGVASANLRSVNFNTAPIGAGPFRWQSLAVSGDTPSTRQEQISLTSFKNYNGGQPKLDGFVLRSFHNPDELIKEFKAGVLNGMAGLDSLQDGLKSDGSINVYSLPLNVANMIFFNNSQGVLADKNVRQAITLAANTNKIINGLGYPVIPVREPLLQGQLGFNAKYAQLGYNPAEAISTLQKDGWITGPNGIRYKNNQPLQFQLYIANTPEFEYVAGQLVSQWRKVGVDAKVVPGTSDELKQTISSRGYDALLYGISIGVDPDVFVYWDSSQADPRSPTQLNFSEYKSAVADSSLEAGRTRLTPVLRAIKYKVFLKTWQQDAPALGLYQPRFLYLTNQPVYGLRDHRINQATDRFDNVQNWEINTAKLPN